MALSDRNIVITPNRGRADDPKIEFSGANANVTAQTITLRVYPDNSGTLSFEGSAGQLFSITNDLSGTLFSVNDSSGIPSLEVNADGTVTLAEFSGNVGIGTGTPLDKLHVEGAVRFTQVSVGNGTVSSPSFKFYNDPNTGIYLSDTDTLSLVTNGTIASSFTSTGDLRLYNTAGTFYSQFSNQPTANRTLTVPDVSGTISIIQAAATAGYFDTSTTTPTGTTRLNYGGYFYPTAVNLVGMGDTTTAATHYFVETGTDGFVRPKTLANVKTEIVTTAAVNSAAATTVGTVTSGTWAAGSVTSSSTIQAAGTATVNALVSNGAISGTTGTFSGDLSIADKIVHTGDTDTAIRFPANDTVTIETVGSERLRVDSNGNVGIATATVSAGYKLQVQGSVKSTGTIDADVQFLGQASDTVSAPSFSWTGDTNVGMYRPATDTIGFTTAGAERVRITSTGNVGIATTTVQTGYHLQVQGNSAFSNRVGIGTTAILGLSNTLAVYGTAMVYGNIDIRNPTGGTSGVYFGDGTYQTTAFVGAATPSFGPVGTIQVAGAGNAFTGDGSNFFWDNSNNRLGIGTASPTNVLTVRSTATPAWFNTVNSAIGSNNYEILVGNSIVHGTSVGYVNNAAVPYGYLSAGTTTRNIIIAANGRVGLGGTTVPQNILDVNGAVAIGAAYAGARTAPSNGLLVQGSVGIGTFSPSTALHVEGTIKGSVVSAGNGTVSSLGFRFDGEPTTGIYLSATNTLSFVTSGTLASSFTSTGDLRLYNTAGTFYSQFSNQPTANRTLTIPDVGGTISIIQAAATAGYFDTSTTTPTGTTRLNYGGYFYPSYINLVGSSDTATAATHYFVETGTDGFVRPKTLANVRTEIVTAAAVNAALGSAFTVKNANYTAVNGDKLLCDTSGGTFTITLPATPSLGTSVIIYDKANFTIFPLTIARNGSTIENLADDFSLDIGQTRNEIVYDGSTWHIYVSIGPRGLPGANASVSSSVAYSIALG